MWKGIGAFHTHMFQRWNSEGMAGLKWLLALERKSREKELHLLPTLMVHCIEVLWQSKKISQDTQLWAHSITPECTAVLTVQLTNTDHYKNALSLQEYANCKLQTFTRSMQDPWVCKATLDRPLQWISLYCSLQRAYAGIQGRTVNIVTVLTQR